jgi:hypothetical protein
VALTVSTEEPLPVGARPERGFGPWQARQGLAKIVQDAMQRSIQPKRWKARKRMLLAALEAYAKANNLSPEDRDWVRRALALLGHDMFSVVLPQLPGIRVPGMDMPQAELDAIRADPAGRRFPEHTFDIDQASLDAWTHELRRLMNKEATEELVGTGREDLVEMSLEADLREAIPIEQERHALLEILFALNSARLTPDDRRAMLAILAADGDQTKAAQALGWPTTALWQRVYRIHQKLA